MGRQRFAKGKALVDFEMAKLASFLGWQRKSLEKDL